MYLPPNPQNVRDDIKEILESNLPWKSLSNKRILVTGAAGMLPAYIVDTLLLLPEYFKCAPPLVTALVRNRDKAEKRFFSYLNYPNFEIRTDNICNPLDVAVFSEIEVIIHAASIPRPDGEKPVDVMAPNILGTWNLLEVAQQLPNFEQFLFFSSGIVNGENIISDTPISEDMFFPSSCTSPAACYSESKRAGETICLSFMSQYDIPIKLIRNFGTYGPGMDLDNDPRAFTAFMKNAINGEDIVLHSKGEETRFWCYITDATEAFFRVFFSSSYGEAWNVANDEAGSTIYEFAQTVGALSPDKEITIQFNKNKVPPGYTPFKSQQITIPGISKLRKLGYMPKISVKEGVRRTINAHRK